MTLRILVVDDLYATSGKHRGHLDGLLASLGVAATYSAGQRRDNGQHLQVRRTGTHKDGVSSS